MGTYEVDTTSDDNIWVVLRRVHFFAGDQIARGLDAIEVGVRERRLLDALAYADSCGLPSAPTATLCVVVQAPMKPSTALSTLRRMTKRGWVKAVADETGGQTWALAEQGHDVRSLYGQIAEQVQEQIYAEADRNLHEHLDRFGRRAVRFMDERVLPILDAAGHLVPDPTSRTTWSALRQIHFHLSDLIVRETASMGVGMNERRVLDALGYARKMGVENGLSVATICRLNPSLTRQTVLSTLEKATARGWLGQTAPTTPRGWLWDLTEKGVRIRYTYKRYAQHKLREVYEINTDDEQLFLQLVLYAQAYRDARLEPVINRVLSNRQPNEEAAL